MALTGSGVRVGLVDLDYLAPGIGERTGEAGHDICRDQVARLMPARNIQGVSRQRRKAFTTRQDPAPVDLGPATDLGRYTLTRLRCALRSNF